MASKFFHAVAWIDHQQARIFHFDAERSEFTCVRSHHAGTHLHHKANSIDSGHAAVDTEYLESVAKALEETGAILVTGPAGAKTELMSHIGRRHPLLAVHVAAVETSDHPTDGQILAHGRAFFKAHDRMQSQTTVMR